MRFGRVHCACCRNTVGRLRVNLRHVPLCVCCDLARAGCSGVRLGARWHCTQAMSHTLWAPRCSCPPMCPRTPCPAWYQRHSSIPRLVCVCGGGDEVGGEGPAMDLGQASKGGAGRLALWFLACAWASKTHRQHHTTAEYGGGGGGEGGGARSAHHTDSTDRVNPRASYLPMTVSSRANGCGMLCPPVRTMPTSFNLPHIPHPRAPHHHHKHRPRSVDIHG
jgi:hypothetical protein